MSNYFELKKLEFSLQEQLKKIKEKINSIPKKEITFEKLDKEFNEYCYYNQHEPSYLLLNKESYNRLSYLAYCMSNFNTYRGYPIIVSDIIPDFEWVG